MNLRGLIVPLPEEGLDDADFAMDDEEIEDDGHDGTPLIIPSPGVPAASGHEPART